MISVEKSYSLIYRLNVIIISPEGPSRHVVVHSSQLGLSKVSKFHVDSDLCIIDEMLNFSVNY